MEENKKEKKQEFYVEQVLEGKRYHLLKLEKCKFEEIKGVLWLRAEWKARMYNPDNKKWWEATVTVDEPMG